MCRSFDWTHMVTTFIRSPEATVYILAYFKSPIKIKRKQNTFNQNYSEEKHVWGYAHKQFVTREVLKENRRLTKLSGTKNLAFNLVILMRIPPYFLSKSRVLHLVCTPTGVYSRKGGPRSSHVLLFQKIFMSTIMNGDGNYAWFYSGIFISKGLWSATLSQGHKKSYWITEDLIWRFLTRRNLFVFPCIPEGVFVGRFTQTKFTVNFHLFIQYKNAGQHIPVNI